MPAASLDQLSPGDCYERLWNYFSANRASAQQRLSRSADAEIALRLLVHLPTPATATDADRDVLFVEVLSGWFETFFTQRDDSGVALNEYARGGLRPYPKGMHDAGCVASRRKSGLYRWTLGYRAEQDYLRQEAARDQKSVG